MEQREFYRPKLLSGVGSHRCTGPLLTVNRISKQLIPVGLLSLAFFVAAARNRLIDGDEGFYLLASRLVFQHEMPYRDFLYTQMPLLPYVYGLWMQLIGISWLSARLLSACLTSVLSVFLYVEICRETRRSAAGIFGVLLFGSSTLVFGWMPIVKTYALSSLLLFSCYVIVSRVSSRSPKQLLFVGGLLLGLSVEVRLYFVAVLPIFLLWIYRKREIGSKRTAIFYFVSGFLTAMLPSFYFFTFHRDAFLFDVLGIHAIRSDQGLIGGFGQKILTLARSISFGPKGNGIQLGMLLLISSMSRARKRMSDPARLAFQIAISLGIICLLPTPAYTQYLCVIIPFLIVCAVCPLADLATCWNWKQRPKLAFAVLCGVMIYITIPIADYTKYFVTGENVVGTSPNEGAANWRLEMVRLVSGAIDKLARPGEAVVSFWPGYIVQSTAFPYSGLECDSGITFSAELNSDQLIRYHIASRGQIERDINSRIPRIVILGNQEYWHKTRQPYVAVLARAGYAVARRIGDTLIYVRH